MVLKNVAVVHWANVATDVLNENDSYTRVVDYSVKIIDTALIEMLASAAKPK